MFALPCGNCGRGRDMHLAPQVTVAASERIVTV